MPPSVAPAQCLAEAVVAEAGSAFAEPQFRGVGASVVFSKGQVGAERGAGGGSDGDDASALLTVSLAGSPSSMSSGRDRNRRLTPMAECLQAESRAGVRLVIAPARTGVHRTE